MKTTMQDLIVGHYEGALSPAQETELQALLATSSEARALYEQHGVMQEVMEEESERLVPPFGLREATIGAALGVAAESIGGGIAAWFTTKVAVAIGTVVVGGTAVGIILSTSGDDAPNDQRPAVSAPAAVESAQEGEALEAVGGTASEQNSSTEVSTSQGARPVGSTRQGPAANVDASEANSGREENGASPSEPKVELGKEEETQMGTQTRMDNKQR